MIVKNLMSRIDQGRKGFNKGLSTGLPKLDSVVYGSLRETISLIGGDSGSGKSSYMLYTTVYRPFMEYLNSEKTINVNWLLFSFEMSQESLFCRLLSEYIYEHYGEILPHNEILSLDKTLSDSKYDLILQSQEWLQELESRCTVIDKFTTARHLYGIAKEWTTNFGYYKELETVGDFVKTEYIPNDPQQYLIINIDHIRLLKTSPGNGIKQEMDNACNYLITLRDKCKCTINIVQQLNRNFKSMARRTQGSGQYAGIQLDDFSDTSGTVQCANTVIALFHPFREKMSKCNGYDIKILRDRIRILSILKNRDGQSDKSIGLNFFGETHMWRELPKADEITDYTPFITL